MNENELRQCMKENYCSDLYIHKDHLSGCTFIAAMNTSYGKKGNGGTRMFNYATATEGIIDAVRLVKVMTKKCVIIGKPYIGEYSGGKGVIIGDPHTQKDSDMLRRYGAFIQSLHGVFQTGSDLNIDLNDIEYMAEKSAYIDGLRSGLGDTAGYTAHGIYTAMQMIAKYKYAQSSLRNFTIAVQGVGSVGFCLVSLLTQDGAKVIATDKDTKRLHAVQKQYGISIVDVDDIYSVPCDIFSPNATGDVLTQEHIQQLRCSVILGAANNPLPFGYEQARVKELVKKNIMYVPDYVVNIGGVFSSMCETQGKTAQYTFATLKKIIAERLQFFLTQSIEKGKSLFDIAEAFIENELEKTPIIPTIHRQVVAK